MTYHSAQIFFDKSSDALWYTVKAICLINDKATVIFKKTFNNNVVLNNLLPDTKYTVWVASVCLKVKDEKDTTLKVYSEPITFTTKPNPICLAPKGLIANNISGTTAKVSWDLCPLALKYKVRYKIVNSSLKPLCEYWSKQYTFCIK